MKTTIKTLFGAFTLTAVAGASAAVDTAYSSKPWLHMHAGPLQHELTRPETLSAPAFVYSTKPWLLRSEQVEVAVLATHRGHVAAAATLTEDIAAPAWRYSSKPWLHR